MYSPLDKFLAFWIGVLFVVLAGAVVGNPEVSRTAPAAGFLMGLLLLWGYGVECRRQGAQPLTKLKPGTYHVNALVYDNRHEVMFAVCWNTPERGRFRRRLVQLDRNLFAEDRIPQVGDRLIVKRHPGSIYENSRLVYRLSR